MKKRFCAKDCKGVCDVLFLSAHLPMFTYSRLHLITSSHLQMLTSSSLHISHLYIFTYSSISFYLRLIHSHLLSLRHLHIFLSLCFMLHDLHSYISHYTSLRSRAICRLVKMQTCIYIRTEEVCEMHTCISLYTNDCVDVRLCVCVKPAHQGSFRRSTPGLRQAS